MVQYQCERCLKFFSSLGDYKRHIARKKPCKNGAFYGIGPKIYVCDKCHKEFSRKSSYTTHVCRPSTIKKFVNNRDTNTFNSFGFINKSNDIVINNYPVPTNNISKDVITNNISNDIVTNDHTNYTHNDHTNNIHNDHSNNIHNDHTNYARNDHTNNIHNDHTNYARNDHINDIIKNNSNDIVFPPYFYDNVDHFQYLNKIISDGKSIRTSAFFLEHIMYAFIVTFNINTIVIKFGYSHDIIDRTKKLTNIYGTKLILVGLRYVTCQSDEKRFHAYLKHKYPHLVYHRKKSNGSDDIELYKLNPVLLDDFNNFMTKYHNEMCKQNMNRPNPDIISTDNYTNHNLLTKQQFLNANIIRNLSSPSINLININNVYSRIGLKEAGSIWNSVHNMGMTIRTHKFAVMDGVERHFFSDQIYKNDVVGMGNLIKYNSIFEPNTNAMCVFTGCLHGGFICIDVIDIYKCINANTVYLMMLLCNNIVNNTFTCKTTYGFRYLYKLTTVQRTKLARLIDSPQIKLFDSDINIIYNAGRVVVHGSYSHDDVQFNYEITNLVSPIDLPDVVYNEILDRVTPESFHAVPVL